MAISDEERPLLSHEHSRQHESDGKKGIVEFDPNGDPDNPLNWSNWYRWSMTLLLAFIAFTVTFTCIGIVPVAGQVVRDLEGHKDKSASVLFVTIWELGEAAGPLFIAPLSEAFGRYPVYNACNTLLIGGIIITALSQSAGVLIFSRFLTGCAVATNVLNPAIIGDAFPSESRGKAMSAVMLAPLLGGAIGPAVAGALAKEAGWRNVMWLAMGLAAFCEVVFLTLFRETYKPAILQRRAARLRKETGDESLKTDFDNGDGSKGSTILSSMLRPVFVLWSSVVLQIMSLWGALIFAFFYVMSTSFPDMLEDVYGFDASERGVSFLSWSFGSMIGIVLCNTLVDRIYVRLQAQRGGKTYHEGRLPLVITGAFCMPPVVALYGYSAGLRWPVAALLVFVFLMGIGIVISIVPMLTYVTDSFGLYSASALTAVLVTRCLAGTFIPLATAALTDMIGYGPGFLVLGAACLLLAPIPALVMRYGPQWRQRSEYSRDDS